MQNVNDMVWIMEISGQGEVEVVHCEVRGVIKNNRGICYDLVAKDNPKWSGQVNFNVEQEAVYSSMSKAMSCLSMLKLI